MRHRRSKFVIDFVSVTVIYAKVGEGADIACFTKLVAIERSEQVILERVSGPVRQPVSRRVQLSRYVCSFIDAQPNAVLLRRRSYFLKATAVSVAVGRAVYDPCLLAADRSCVHLVTSELHTQLYDPVGACAGLLTFRVQRFLRLELD